MSILQITDIHINGEYNGQFDVKKHFKQILEANRTRDFDAIALTGDLADEGSYKDYTEIFNQVEETFGNGTPILAIPGNHDNREHLDLAYMDYINRGHNFKPGTYLQRIGGTFEEPGKCVVILTLPGILAGSGNTKLIGMDNAHKELPHQGLEAFLDHEWDRKSADSYTLFMHMPLIKPFHRFMNVDVHSIDEDAAKTFMWALRDFYFRGIICGHYHCASVTSFNDFVQFVAPASQCQLDPFTKDCTPSGNYPGYAIICPGMHEMHMCKFHYIVEDENGN
jgi:DNA repair exonuclease SbcCD nuclease subunit